MPSAETAIDAVVSIGICGNAAIEADEDCEGADLGGATCMSLGFGGGALSCDIACSFDTSMCSGAPPPPLARSAPPSGAAHIINNAPGESASAASFAVPFSLSSGPFLDIAPGVADMNESLWREIFSIPQLEEVSEEALSIGSLPAGQPFSPAGEPAVLLASVGVLLVLPLIWLFKKKF